MRVIVFFMLVARMRVLVLPMLAAMIVAVSGCQASVIMIVSVLVAVVMGVLVTVDVAVGFLSMTVRMLVLVLVLVVVRMAMGMGVLFYFLEVHDATSDFSIWFERYRTSERRAAFSEQTQ